MRPSPLVPMLVLLAAAFPALAQEFGPPSNPEPIQPAEQQVAPKPAKKRAIRKTVRIRAPAAKIPLPRPAPLRLAKAAPEPAAPPLPEKRPAADAAKPAPQAAPVKSDFTATAGIPSDETLSVQSALLWAGDFPAARSGEDPLVAAIKNFQKRKKAKVTGVLTPAQRAELVAADKNHEDEFGWRVVVDPATGVRIGIPAKLVPHVHDAARGTRWSSAYGEVQVETFRIKDAGLSLPALFEREKSKPARKVAHSVLRDDNFFISGMQGLKYFSVRAQMRDGEVRGFTMLYDQMMEGIVAPVMVAMASAFSPFPERSAPFAALARPVEYGTGLIVSAQGHIVTAARMTEGCQVMLAAGLGDAERIAVDKATGLALLRVYGRHRLAALALPHEAPKSGELRLIGIPDPKQQGGREKLTEIKGQLAGSDIELRQPVPVAGFSGAAALDARGRVLGMMQTRNAVLAGIEPAAAPVRLVSALAIREFLAAHQVPAAATTAGGDARASVVRIICVRK